MIRNYTFIFTTKLRKCPLSALDDSSLSGAVITLVSNYLICPFVLLVTFYKKYSSCNYKTINNGEKKKKYYEIWEKSNNVISLFLSYKYA